MCPFRLDDREPEWERAAKLLDELLEVAHRLFETDPQGTLTTADDDTPVMVESLTLGTQSLRANHARLIIPFIERMAALEQRIAHIGLSYDQIRGYLSEASTELRERRSEVDRLNWEIKDYIAENVKKKRETGTGDSAETVRSRISITTIRIETAIIDATAKIFDIGERIKATSEQLNIEYPNHPAFIQNDLRARFPTEDGTRNGAILDPTAVRKWMMENGYAFSIGDVHGDLRIPAYVSNELSELSRLAGNREKYLLVEFFEPGEQDVIDNFNSDTNRERAKRDLAWHLGNAWDFDSGGKRPDRMAETLDRARQLGYKIFGIDKNTDAYRMEISNAYWAERIADVVKGAPAGSLFTVWGGKAHNGLHVDDDEAVSGFNDRINARSKEILPARMPVMKFATFDAQYGPDNHYWMQPGKLYFNPNPNDSMFVFRPPIHPGER